MGFPFRKYLTVTIKSALKSFEYRGEISLWVIFSTVPNLLLLLIWQSLYRGQSTINGYTVSQVLQYFMVGLFINNITASHFEGWRVREIREGKIDYLLTKPLSYLQYVFLYDLGGKLFFTAFSTPIFILSYVVISVFLPIGSVHFSAVTLAQFCFLLIIGYLIEFLCAAMTVLLGFWFQGSDGLEHFKWIVITLLSGWMIPIAFMPAWLQQIVTFLPLKYMYAVPISLLQQKTSLGWGDVVYAISSVGFLSLMAYALWRRAMYKYTSAGG